MFYILVAREVHAVGAHVKIIVKLFNKKWFSIQNTFFLNSNKVFFLETPAYRIWDTDLFKRGFDT